MSDRVVSMQTLVRAVDGGSLSAAARALGKSLAAVSRTVTQLEERLGARLLNRSTRRLTPTEAGAAFYDSAKRILAEIDEAELAIGGRAAAPRGTFDRHRAAAVRPPARRAGRRGIPRAESRSGGAARC